MGAKRQSRLPDLMLAAAVTVAVPVIAFVVWPLVSARMATPPQGTVLTYEVDPGSEPGGAAADPDQLVEAIERRVNTGPEKTADVRVRDDGRIEVALMRPDDAETQRVKESLALTATLEFRVLANRRCDKELIERASADPAKTRVLDDKGKLAAWWVPVHVGKEVNLDDYSDIVRRTRKQGDEEILEVLVVNDPYDVTGAYLTKAEAGVDRRGQPILCFTFNTRGGQRFRSLTSTHLPDKVNDIDYKLGVIFNGELRSVPLIVSTVHDYAEITNSFTKLEVADLVSVLKTGSLPARIRLAAERASP